MTDNGTWAVMRRKVRDAGGGGVFLSLLHNNTLVFLIIHCLQFDNSFFLGGRFIGVLALIKQNSCNEWDKYL